MPNKNYTFSELKLSENQISLLRTLFENQDKSNFILPGEVVSDIYTLGNYNLCKGKINSDESEVQVNITEHGIRYYLYHEHHDKTLKSAILRSKISLIFSGIAIGISLIALILKFFG